MAESPIETITNDLANGYKELVPGTFQEAAEVMVARRTDPPLRESWVYTANLPLYRMSPQQPQCLEFGLSSRQAFDEIAGRDIVAFTQQILEKEFYTLTPEQRELLKTLPGIVWVLADDLQLTQNNAKWSYLTIPTSGLRAEGLHPAQRIIASQAYGSLESKTVPDQTLSDYGESMDMLQKAGIQETRIWLPTPEYVRAAIPNGQMLARASRLFDFGVVSWFDANDRNVDNHSALRGVPVVAEGDAQKIEDVYALLQRPAVAERAAEMLNPRAAAAMSNVLSLYLAKQTNKDLQPLSF